MREARQRASVSHRTLERVIRDHQLTTYRNPADLRLRLVKAADLDAITTPQPIRRHVEGGQPAPNPAA
jgi:hypothetical protein